MYIRLKNLKKFMNKNQYLVNILKLFWDRKIKATPFAKS